MTQPIGVLGATGQQGGAVIDALLEQGRSVRAIVRSPESQRAQALAARGVGVAPGDQDDPATLPLTGLESLFVMSTFTGDGGTAGETRRANGVVDAAAAAGVPRIVYSSVGGAERSTSIPHFESKWRVEQHAREVIPTAVVRPAFFMENFAAALDDAGQDEFVLRQPMPGDVPLQMVAVRDIGVVAAAALIDPDAIDGAVEIAGDELTCGQVAERIGAQRGRPARFEQLPYDAFGDADLEAMYRWFVDTPAYAADFERTRALDPAVLDLAGWLRAR